MKISKTITEKSESAKEFLDDLKEFAAGFEKEDWVEDARIAASLFGNESWEILKADATLEGNSMDPFKNHNFDVWMDIYAYNYYAGFFSIGCYLSDIYSIGGDDNEEVKGRMLITEYRTVN